MRDSSWSKTSSSSIAAREYIILVVRSSRAHRAKYKTVNITGDLRDFFFSQRPSSKCASGRKHNPCWKVNGVRIVRTGWLVCVCALYSGASMKGAWYRSDYLRWLIAPTGETHTISHVHSWYVLEAHFMQFYICFICAVYPQRWIGL